MSAAPVGATADRDRRAGALDVTVRGVPEGAPLAGAHVRALTVVDERAYLVESGDTDAQGRARFDGLPRGEAWILADATDHARGSTRLAVDGSARTVAIDLAREHTLDVLARDEVGAPVPRAARRSRSSAPGEPLRP